MRKVNAELLENVSRSRKSQFSECEVGETYFLTRGVDYRENDVPTKEDDQNQVPKENSIRTSLATFAKSKSLKVTVHRKKDRETGADGLSFKFFKVEPVVKNETGTANTTNETSGATGELKG